VLEASWFAHSLHVSISNPTRQGPPLYFYEGILRPPEATRWQALPRGRASLAKVVTVLTLAVLLVESGRNVRPNSSPVASEPSCTNCRGGATVVRCESGMAHSIVSAADCPARASRLLEMENAKVKVGAPPGRCEATRQASFSGWSAKVRASTQILAGAGLIYPPPQNNPSNLPGAPCLLASFCILLIWFLTGS
jgi:hypothetical protein